MKILHHGATEGVTGSCHQLVIDEHNSLLVDCGLFQGADITEHNEHDILSIDFDINTVKALLVTHCHIDHVGRIPYLLAAGFKGPIIATEATIALLPMVIEDALKVGVTRNQSIIKALDELENDILQFIELLQSIFPKITIERIDERYTSKISSFIIRQSGVNKKSRMNKSIIDKISASLILESYLIMNKK